MSAISAILGIGPAALWAALAALLLVLEMMAAGGFVLSFAIAAGLVALKVLIAGPNDGNLDLWDWLLFSVIGVALIWPLRYAIRRYADRTKDINQLD